MALRPIVTLLTDFGHRDPFVGIMKGVILRFGNCFTNLRAADVEGWERVPATVEAKEKALGRIVTHFAAVPRGAAGGVVGSSGYLELFVNQGHCAAQWNLAVGDRVVVQVG